VEPTREQVVIRAQAAGLDPRGQVISGLLGDFKLHRTLRLLLHQYRARGDHISMTYVPNAQPDEIARPQLAIDGQVEEPQLSRAMTDLQPHSNCLDILQLQRSLLPNQLALVPGRLARCNMSRWFHDGLPAVVDDRLTLRRRQCSMFEPQPTVTTVRFREPIQRDSRRSL
jgi:hypothetical protein